MARKPRVHFFGALYHIILRGNNGQTIFFTDQDRLRFFLLLQEGIERFGHRVHGFCLMENHVHLAIQVGKIPLSRILQNLGFRYTRWINRRQNRRGHLFQGRYKAVLVDADVYLQALIRYIHLNPVRAGVVGNPADYPFSGHRAYLGLEKIPWLTTDWVLSRLSDSPGRARKIYDKYVSNGKGGRSQWEYQKGSKTDSRILGNESFIDRVLVQKESMPRSGVSTERIFEEVCHLYSIEEKDLKTAGRERRNSEARAVMAWLILELGVGTLSELGKLTRRDIATLSSGVKRLRSRAINDSALGKKMETLLERFSRIEIMKA
jgi:REP element-mobilizing transposase RayT